MIAALHFGYPLRLIGLAVPILLLIWVWTRKGRRVALPFDGAQAGRGRWLRTMIQGAESLPMLSFAVGVILLAGPQKLDAPKTKRSLTNIQFCVDISGSMTAEMGDGTRYDAAMKAINSFLDYRKGDAFALTFFGNNVLHWVPLTQDTSAFRCAPPFMDPSLRNLPSWFGGTEIGKALKACREVLVSREEGDRMIILISDGQSWDLNGGQDMEVAKLLRESGITMYGIHVAGGEVPGTVVNIAVETDGDFFAADDPIALETIFKRIDEMEAAKLEKVAAEYIDDFEPWCWAGGILLALHALLQFFLRFTPW